jgi:hypothetical protein
MRKFRPVVHTFTNEVQAQATCPKWQAMSISVHYIKAAVL